MRLSVSHFRRVAVFGLLGVALASCSWGDAPDAGELDPIYARPAEDIEILKLGRNETLGELLSGSVDANEQYSLLLAFREQASPRRMRVGTEITLRFRPEDHWLRRVDVALDRDQTVRLNRDMVAGWSSQLVETPVYLDTIFAAGEIRSSLWNAVVGNDALDGLPDGDRAGLIDRLDKVFQWQVDFSRQIRVGDTYRFAFEREVRPDGSTRGGRLLAAELVNGGTPYYAVYFDPNGDGEGSYFDLDGKSVRRAFLMKPLEFRRISDRFTNARYHPILKKWRAHKGVDYAADAGTPIMATGDGVVVSRGMTTGGYGNLIEIRHPNGFRTRYGHLRGFARGLHVGSRVHQGDVIGYVGMTGLATGPHLHYEMIRSGRQVDPLSVKLPAGDPVPSQARAQWQEAMSARVALLETIPGAGPVRTTAQIAQADVDDGSGEPNDAGG